MFMVPYWVYSVIQKYYCITAYVIGTVAFVMNDDDVDVHVHGVQSLESSQGTSMLHEKGNEGYVVIFPIVLNHCSYGIRLWRPAKISCFPTLLHAFLFQVQCTYVDVPYTSTPLHGLHQGIVFAACFHVEPIIHIRTCGIKHSSHFINW